MIGAILGDMIGAPYEFDRGNKSKDFPLFCRYSQFTDDSVMTIAVAEALLDTPGLLWPRLDDPLAARRLAYIAAIRDEVLDTAQLAIQLLTDLIAVTPKTVQERFKIKDLSLRGPELLDAVCQGRGFLMKGGVYDTERACKVVLDEFRGGKLGRITLEALKEDESSAPREETADDEA